ncbi:hypothetical protein HDU77_011839 [Chytriomyces hyalinus]|nr:hypothetical protein HDU77_011839 [Chytriomyces hyalinus]
MVKRPNNDALRQVMLRVAGVLLILLLPFTLLAPRHAPVVFAAYYAFLNAVLALSTWRTALGIAAVWFLSRRHSHQHWSLEADDPDPDADQSRFHLRLKDVVHIILLPNYKEDPETLSDTLNVLASHARARSNYKICLAMEASEEGCAEKAQSIADLFHSSFLSIEFSVHPKNLPGEMRGKSSNVSWAAKHMAATVPAEESHKHIITATDADSCFTADYFESVASHYVREQDPLVRRIFLFVPIILFDRNASSVAPFVRMFDFSWSSAHMAFFLPYYPFAPALSSYSVPLDLCAAVDFWDTGAEAMAEDMHMTLKLTMATGGRLRTIHIYSPISQCNVVGVKKTWSSDTYARLVQLKRHDWGGALEFSYFLRIVFSRLFSFNRPSSPSKLPKDFFAPATFLGRCKQATTLSFMFYHMWEITVWAIHAVIINVLAIFLVPGAGPAFVSVIPNAYWNAVAGNMPVPAILPQTFAVVSYIQLSLLPTVVAIAIAYEGMYSWCHVGRWNLDNHRKGSESNHGYTSLGARSSLVSDKRKWYQFWEWILFIISAAVFALFMCWVSLLQLGSDQLEYVVAAKPKSVSNTPLPHATALHTPTPSEEVRVSSSLATIQPVPEADDDKFLPTKAYRQEE